MKVALVLGSGGARGWAHIGVIEELEARGHEIVAVSGSSIGAVVGGAWAAGKLPELKEWITGLTKREVRKYYDWSLGGPGLLRGEKITAAIAGVVGNPRIEDLRAPFTVVCVDLLTGREVWFQKGPLQPAIRASFSLPGIFWPVRVGDRILVDGGVLNPLPVEPVLPTDFDAVVAVNLRGPVLHDPHEQYLEAKVSGEENDDAAATSGNDTSGNGASSNATSGFTAPLRAVADSHIFHRAGAALEGLRENMAQHSKGFTAATRAAISEAIHHRDPQAHPTPETESTASAAAARELDIDAPTFGHNRAIESHVEAPEEILPDLPKGMSLFQVGELAIAAMQNAIGRYRAAAMPVSVRIEIPADIVDTLDFHMGKEMIAYGREKAARALDDFPRAN
ncbi:patatin-like phospholipase family protein [Actinobaculum suis]|uniref:patatin-like phospholipase family protein n=1 Tax=Actinobaculum suis TaxID=1657 RepID=UPI00080870D0|nr:patatin-like phospholipase family protein [Actinobaculum suis]OCA93083.1 hypothetical protein ACU21_01110 [Actinobaculum suis]OCA93514.1 hypothetical protein ACU20_01595 [Actinobaculum suis]